MQRASSVTKESPSPVASLWIAAHKAQADGDHRRAEKLFATIVAWSPADAEAWFLRAVSAGWNAPRGSHRFDEVRVGIAIALERQLPGRRAAMRTRAARAMALLGELRWDDSTAMLSDLREHRSLRDHLALGRAAIVLVDAACELDPESEPAAWALARLAGEVIGTARLLRELDDDLDVDDVEALAQRALCRADAALTAAARRKAAGPPSSGPSSDTDRAPTSQAA